MAKERPRLLSPWCTSFCLLLLCLYLLIQKVTDHPLPDLSVLLTSNSQETEISGGKVKPDSSVTSPARETPPPTHPVDPCVGRYIYVHELARKFNEAIIEDCEHITRARNMCIYLENHGFGHEMGSSEGVFSNSGWYDTDQFTLDVIFHDKMKQYDCLTRNSSLAAAIFVPFYAGLEVYTRIGEGVTPEVRDSMPIELMALLRESPEWRVMGGKDHFMVAGRMTWEFRRKSDWRYAGNRLLLLPEVQNMSTLLIESSPLDTNDFGIPYPTCFHPSTDEEMLIWQDRMRKMKREHLFSFAGAPRPSYATSIRGQLIDQCNQSSECEIFKCIWDDIRCHSPALVMSLFEKSIFCLQPVGDSATRKSTFDSMVAGCIPVFFHPASAYVQYNWHFPKDHNKYSVFIWEDDIRKKNVSIEGILKQISWQRIQEMREEVINLIPKLIYANPDSKKRTFKDSFDVAVEAVIKRVKRLRQIEVYHEDPGPEEKSHEWDRYIW